MNDTKQVTRDISPILLEFDDQDARLFAQDYICRCGLESVITTWINSPQFPDQREIDEVVIAQILNHDEEIIEGGIRCLCGKHE